MTNVIFLIDFIPIKIPLWFFFQFYKKNEIVFCKDICHEIDWLANVRSTFQYVNMGIMFCCRIDEVQKSKLLENFPNLLLKTDTKSVAAALGLLSWLLRNLSYFVIISAHLC